MSGEDEHWKKFAGYFLRVCRVCTLQRTTRELSEIQSALPQDWTLRINSQDTPEAPDLQPRFAIKSSNPSNPPTDILTCKTRTFYCQLLKDQQTTIPAIEHWNQNLQPQPTLNAKQWKTLYPPLNCNKHGDVNWKIAHRVLPTALSLNKTGVHANPNCHRCGTTDTLEHALLDCPTVVNFWSKIQEYIDKITDHKLSVSTKIKILGRCKKENDNLEPLHTFKARYKTLMFQNGRRMGTKGLSIKQIFSLFFRLRPHHM